MEELRILTTEVNRDRKNFQVCIMYHGLASHSVLISQQQTRIGAQLTSLETRWTELISNILQIEMANVALEAEIEKLNKTEAELSGGL